MSDKLTLDIFFIVVVVVAFLIPILVIYQSVRESHQNTIDFPESPMKRRRDCLDELEMKLWGVRLDKIESDIQKIRRELHEREMAELRKTDTP